MLFGRLRVPSAGISVCFLVQVSAYSSLIFGIEKNLDGMIGGLDIQEILAVGSSWAHIKNLRAWFLLYVRLWLVWFMPNSWVRNKGYTWWIRLFRYLQSQFNCRRSYQLCILAVFVVNTRLHSDLRWTTSHQLPSSGGLCMSFLSSSSYSIWCSPSCCART